MVKHAPTTNKDIVHILRSVAAALLIKKANVFRRVAYEKAADTIDQMAREIKDVWQDGKLDDVPGIGPAIAAYLDEYFKTGKIKHFETIFKGIPAATFELMRVPRMGPMKAYTLAKTFNLEDPRSALRDVRRLAKEDKISGLPNFGEKSQQVILEGLDQYERMSAAPYRMPLPYANEIAQDIIQYLKANKHIHRIDALGSLRRMVPTIGDIDIAVTTDAGCETEVVEYFLKYPKKASVDNQGDKKASIIIPPRVRVDFRVQDPASYGAMLQYFTGSKAHNIKLRELALTKGYSLNEYGIKDIDGKNKKDLSKEHPTHLFESEEKFYGFLGLPYIPPEIREGTNEIEMARKHKLPHLVELTDIKGDLHTHSSYDLKPSHDFGADDYVTMCKKSKELGYSYIGFADHNPKQAGHTDKEIVYILKTRKEHIEKVCKLYKNDSFSYFIGLEVDILPSGELSIPEEAIDYLDYMVVSVHSSFGLNIKVQTKRVVRALLHPKVKILGHPTGRLLGKREGIELDFEQVFEVCKKRQIALEINSWPERLDLPDTLVREAISADIACIINTDAHAAYQMDGMPYGVSVARRGWATKFDIVNTKSLPDFEKWLELQ